MTTSALWEMFKFHGNMGEIYRFYPWAGVVTGPYIPKSGPFDSLPPLGMALFRTVMEGFDLHFHSPWEGE